MKKILFLCAVALVFQSSCEAKDYAKMHMKQMKKNQEYRVENTYFAQSASLKKVVSVLDEDCINEVVVYKNGLPVATLSQADLSKMVKNYPLSWSLAKILG